MGISVYMERQRQVKAEIRHVEDALRRWNPIGVVVGSVEDGCPMDEYDSYAPAIVSLLSRGGTVDQVADHLETIRVRRMGLPALRAADSAIATELVAWWANR